MYPFADTVYQLLFGGFLRATSVGFTPVKCVYNQARGGADFTEQEPLEFSVVPMPASAEAPMAAAVKVIDVTRPVERQRGDDTIEADGIVFTVRELKRAIAHGVNCAMTRATGRLRDDEVVLEVEDEEVDLNPAEVHLAAKDVLPGIWL